MSGIKVYLLKQLLLIQHVIAKTLSNQAFLFGSLAILTSLTLYTTSYDNAFLSCQQIMVDNLMNLHQLKTIPDVYSFMFTPDGRRLIVVNSSAVIAIDTTNGMEAESLDLGPLYDRNLSPSYERVLPVTGISVNENSNKVAISITDTRYRNQGKQVIWSLDDDKTKIIGNDVATFQSAFTTNDGLVYLSNLANFELHITNSSYDDVDTIVDLPSRLNPYFDTAPQILASLTNSGLVLWNPDLGQKYSTLDIAPDVIFVLSPDGKLMATWNNSSDLISIWDIRTNTKRAVIKVNDVINKVIFSNDSKLFTVGTHRNKHLIKLWEVNNLQVSYELLGHKDVVSGLSFSKDNTLLASSSWDGTIKIWDTETHQEVKTFRSASQNPIKVEFSPDERSLISLNDTGIEIWCSYKR